MNANNEKPYFSTIKQEPELCERDYGVCYSRLCWLGTVIDFIWHSMSKTLPQGFGLSISIFLLIGSKEETDLSGPPRC